jgi:hypothetical protein
VTSSKGPGSSPPSSSNSSSIRKRSRATPRTSRRSIGLILMRLLFPWSPSANAAPRGGLLSPTQVGGEDLLGEQASEEAARVGAPHPGLK